MLFSGQYVKSYFWWVILFMFVTQNKFPFECFFNVLSICVCFYVCVSLAFVTLLNGDQAQDAIRNLHQTSVRGRDITVQLQPTDSLLCVTNLPYTLTATQFQELVRTYGNIERCFLVYSDLTGHSKGYGFVEYMKKDSASRARSELLGKPLGDRALMVQWADVNQLTSTDHLHSKCLCVDRLPLDFEDSEELAHIFSEHYKTVFCQVRWGGVLLWFGVFHLNNIFLSFNLFYHLNSLLIFWPMKKYLNK